MLTISNIATFTVPENFVLLFKDTDNVLKGKKNDNTLVPLDSDDLIRLGVAEADLPILASLSEYTSVHALANVNNLDVRSAMSKSAMTAYTKMVAGQKVSNATFVTQNYLNDQKFSTLTTAVSTLDNSIDFTKIINKISVYPGPESDVGKMVTPGVYYCATDAAKTGNVVAHTDLPLANCEGILLVTGNSQVFIEGGTAKGRMYYRYETAAANPTEYTEDWTPSAMLSDVTALETSLTAIIGTLPTDKTAAEAIADVDTLVDTLRTAVEGISGSNAIEVTADATDAAKKAISLKLDGTSLSQSANGLKADLVVAKQETAETGFAATYFLTDAGGTNVYGAKINIVKDQFLKSQPEIISATTDAAPDGWNGDTYVKGHKYLKFTWQLTRADGSADSDTNYVSFMDVNSMFASYTSGSGAIIVDNDENKIKLKIDTASEKVTTAADTTADVLTQGTDGVKVSNIQTAINYAVSTEKTRAEGAEATLQTNIDTEASTRATAISTEAAAREEADASLQANIDNGLALKTTTLLTDESGNKSYIFNELDGGGAKIERSAASGVKNVFVGVNLSDGDRAENHALASIYALDADSVGTRFTVFNDMITYKANASKADRNLSAYELAVKDDVATAKSEAISAAATDAASQISTAQTTILGQVMLLDGTQAMTGDVILRQVGGQAPGSTVLVTVGATPAESSEDADESTINFSIKYGMGESIVSTLTPDGSIVLTQTVGDNRYLTNVAQSKAGQIIIAKDSGKVETSGYKAGTGTLQSIAAIISEEDLDHPAESEVTYAKTDVMVLVGSTTYYKWTSSNGDVYTSTASPAAGDDLYYLEQGGDGNWSIDHENTIQSVTTTTSDKVLATERVVVDKANAVAAAAQEALDTHAAIDTRHTATVRFIRTAQGSVSSKIVLAYYQYICKAALIGILPTGCENGKKVIVSVVSGGEGTVVYPGTNDKIEGSTDPVAINAANHTVTFIYDADNKEWLVL